MVDLNSPSKISSVEIYNRNDCCQGRIQRAKVLLLDASSKVIRESTINSQDPKIVVNFTNTKMPSLPGVRFLRVSTTRGGDSYLQISQLVALNEYGVNVARGKSVSVYTAYTGTTGSTAVDGNEIARNYPQIYHSATPNANEYFVVDLGEPENISKVIYYNRLDCCKGRIIGATVQLNDIGNNVLKTLTINYGDDKIELSAV